MEPKRECDNHTDCDLVDEQADIVGHSRPIHSNPKTCPCGRLVDASALLREEEARHKREEASLTESLRTMRIERDAARSIARDLWEGYGETSHVLPDWLAPRKDRIPSMPFGIRGGTMNHVALCPDPETVLDCEQAFVDGMAMALEAAGELFEARFDESGNQEDPQGTCARELRRKLVILYVKAGPDLGLPEGWEKAL